MEEIWKPIKGYEGCYEVSNFGRIKSLYSNKVIKPMKKQITGNYISLQIGLYKYKQQKTHIVARLVATAFCENKKYKPCVNHIDFNPENNKSDNLEWVTHKENSEHSQNAGRFIRKVSEYVNGKEVVTYTRVNSKERIDTIQYLLAKNYSLHDIARLFDCSTLNVKEIYNKYCR